MFIGIAAFSAVCCGAGWLWWPQSDEVSFRTDKVKRGDVTAVVASTGILEAVISIDVGTQVTGLLSEVLVDFNDEVKAGQVLARIDPTILEADVQAAEARLASERALHDRLALQLRREEGLNAQGASSAEVLEQVKADFQVAQANLRATQIAVDRARKNLRYTTISAPIDGIVVSRAVDPGQTVNAGMSAPTLFVLAGDLTQMQILAAVDEADIGQVFAEQPVKFTVQAWTNRTFRGKVRQVRLLSALTENVVTYSVVVEAPNDDKKLFPGMTATVEFVTGESKDVLCVPNAALRYLPDADLVPDEHQEVLAAAAASSARGGRGGREGRGGPGGPGGGAPPGGPGGQSPAPGAPASAGAAPSGAEVPPAASGAPPAGTPGGTPGGGRPRTRTVWVREGEEQVRPVAVEVGLSDGKCTEVKGTGIEEGVEVVIGADRAASGGATNPFAPQPAGQRRMGF